MPDHDLEPPRFSRRAFERLLNDWPAVKGMIMSGKINILLSSKKICKVSSCLFLYIRINNFYSSVINPLRAIGHHRWPLPFSMLPQGQFAQAAVSQIGRTSIVANTNLLL